MAEQICGVYLERLHQCLVHDHLFVFSNRQDSLANSRQSLRDLQRLLTTEVIGRHRELLPDQR
jgi:hypothetical protein